MNSDILKIGLYIIIAISIGIFIGYYIGIKEVPSNSQLNCCQDINRAYSEQQRLGIDARCVEKEYQDFYQEVNDCKFQSTLGHLDNWNLGSCLDNALNMTSPRITCNANF